MRSRGEEGARPQGWRGQQHVAGQLFCTCGSVLTASAWGGDGDGGAQPNPAFALLSQLAAGAASALCSLTA